MLNIVSNRIVNWTLFFRVHFEYIVSRNYRLLLGEGHLFDRPYCMHQRLNKTQLFPT